MFDTAYKVALTVGIVVPLISIAFGAFGNVLDLDFDIDGPLDVVMPIGVYDAALGLLVLGGCGQILTVYSVGGGAAMAVSVIAGIVTNRLSRRYLIMPLKRNRANVLNNSTNLIGREGKLAFGIENNHNGIVEIFDLGGSILSYEAKSEGGNIKVNTDVRIIAFDTATQVVTVGEIIN